VRERRAADDAFVMGEDCGRRARIDGHGLVRRAESGAVQYRHDLGMAITGCCVYRGRLIPALRGNTFSAISPAAASSSPTPRN